MPSGPRTFLAILQVLPILNPVDGAGGCQESRDTMEYETSCPLNVSAWNKAAEKKECNIVKQNCVEQINFRYHCVRNVHHNSLVSVCAAVYYLTGKCPEFNIKGKSLQPINDVCSTCPKWYRSDEVYKYPECITSDDSTTNDKITSDGSTTNDKIMDSTTPDMKKESDTILDPLSTIGIIAAILSVAAILLVCIFVVMPRLRTNRERNNDSEIQEPLQSYSREKK